VTFRDAVEKAEADAEVRFQAMVAQAGPNSWHAATWWLGRRRHDDYGQRRQVDLTIEVEAEVRRWPRIRRASRNRSGRM
jgi:hypothetical protein